MTPHPDSGTSENRVSGQPAQRKDWKRFLPLGVLLSGLVLFFALGLDRYLTITALNDHREALLAFTRSNLIAAVLIYAALYVAVVAFSLPGGAVMTITGGFLFGTVLAGSVTVIAATLGATLIFLAARTAFADLLRDRAGPWLKRIEDGFREDGVSYLLVLRLVPLFPFFIVNVAPAFLGVKTRLYMATTFVGIIPGTFVYASVGNGVGTILDAGGKPDLGIIFDPAILVPILGLAVLALIPVAHKHLFRKNKEQS
jgi:uncharacterized membrane protein YdjX (TVP38/TMEM64 family)